MRAYLVGAGDVGKLRLERGVVAGRGDAAAAAS
jgi:hypothetical protein